MIQRVKRGHGQAVDLLATAAVPRYVVLCCLVISVVRPYGSQFHCNLPAAAEGVAETNFHKLPLTSPGGTGSSVQNQWLQKDFSLELNLLLLLLLKLESSM